MTALPQSRFGKLAKVGDLVRSIRTSVISAQLAEEDEKAIESALETFKSSFAEVSGKYSVAERKSKVAAE